MQVVIGIFSIAFFSCTNPKEKTVLYYPIDSLITTQIENLLQKKAAVLKTAILKDKEESITLTPKDSLAWSNELEIFHEIDVMNKPINKNAYQVDVGLSDTQSNLKVNAFTATSELPVKWLKIYYHKSIDKVKRIEAELNEENSLYKSVRFLTLEFQQANNTTLLSAYHIQGGQKMFLGDSVQFAIHGAIKTPYN